MFKNIFYLPFLLVVISPVTSLAFSDYEGGDIEQDFSEMYEPLKVTGDAISWELFADTKEDMKCVIDEEGFDDCLIKPIYSSEIKQLNNQEVELMGFMFPLDPSEKQKNFLMGPYPASCPFNYHVGPAETIEVRLDESIDFSYDPVRVRGVLSVEYDEESGVFYQLRSIP